MRSNAFEYVNWVKHIDAIKKKIQAVKEAKQDIGNPTQAILVAEIVDDISKVWAALSKERKIDKHNQRGENLMLSGTGPHLNPDDIAVNIHLGEAMGIFSALANRALGDDADVEVLDLDILNAGQIRPLNLDNESDRQLLLQTSDNATAQVAFSGHQYQKNLEQRRKEYLVLKQQLLNFKEILESLTQKPFQLNQNYKNITSYDLILAEIEQVQQELKNNLSQILSSKAIISRNQLNKKIKELQNRILVLKILFEREENDLTFIEACSEQSAESQQNASDYAKGLRKEIAEHKNDVDIDAIDLIDELADREDSDIEEPSQVVKAFQSFDQDKTKVAHSMLKTMEKVNGKLATHSGQTVTFIQARLKALIEVNAKLIKIGNDLQRMQQLLLKPSVKDIQQHGFHKDGKEARNVVVPNKGNTAQPMPREISNVPK